VFADQFLGEQSHHNGRDHGNHNQQISRRCGKQLLLEPERDRAMSTAPTTEIPRTHHCIAFMRSFRNIAEAKAKSIGNVATISEACVTVVRDSPLN
jgi:hypothetical protein